MKRKMIMAWVLLFGCLSFSSCSKDYCLECIDPRFGDFIEGCNNDLSEVEAAVEEWENLGYICQIYEN